MNLNSMTVNPELQMDNALRFCKCFCDQLRKEKERREEEKPQQEDQLKIISQQKLSF